MHQMEVVYLGDLRTSATHLASGQKIETDAPVDNQGKGQRFSPTDLTCSSLASCMMTIMGIMAQRDQIDMTKLKARVQKIMASTPRKISEIIVHIDWPDCPLAQDDQKQREKYKRAALTCPVHLSLDESVKKTIHFNF